MAPPEMSNWTRLPPIAAKGSHGTSGLSILNLPIPSSHLRPLAVGL
jgi:hypothetical protein